jgi:predicted dehydrogenase
MNLKRAKKLSCGIIGAGWWGDQMVNNILASKCFDILSIYDSSSITAEKVAKKAGCTVTSSADDVLRDSNIECVFIFSPNDSHLRYATSAALSKKHVFLEKPISNTAAEAEEIVRICEENRVILAVGHNVRHYGIFQKAKEVVDAGLLGKVIYIEGNRSRPIGFGIDENSWRFYKKSCNGGPVIQMAIHLIDAIRFISGLDLEVIQTLSTKRFLKTENDESFSINAKSKSDILIHLFTSYVSPESFYLNFHGTEGILFADPFNGLYLQDKNSIVKRKIKYRKNRPEVEEIREFYKSASEKKPYIHPTPEEAVDNVKIVEEIVRSAI